MYILHNLQNENIRIKTDYKDKIFALHEWLSIIKNVIINFENLILNEFHISRKMIEIFIRSYIILRKKADFNFKLSKTIFLLYRFIERKIF